LLLLFVSWFGEFQRRLGIKNRPAGYEQCNNDSTMKESTMKTILTSTLAIAIMSGCVGSAVAETKSCNDQQKTAQSAKADKHAKKAKETKPKQQQPDNSFYAIFG